MKTVFFLLFVCLCFITIKATKTEEKSHHARENTKALFKFFDVKPSQNIFNDFMSFQKKFQEPEHEQWMSKAKDQPILWTGVMNYFGVSSVNDPEKDFMNLGETIEPQTIIKRMIFHIFSEFDLNNDGYLNPDEFTSFMWDSSKHYNKPITLSMNIKLNFVFF